MMEYITNVLSPMLVSFGASVFFVMVFSRLAIRIGLTDSPSQERKKHHSDVPVVGGLAIAVGVFLGILWVPFSLVEYRTLFFCLIVIIMIGIADDFSEVSSLARVGAQFFVACLLVYGDDVVIHSIGPLSATSPYIELGIFSEVVSVLSIVALINAFNLIDGHDGLCGSLVVVTLVVLGMYCREFGYWEQQRVLFIVVAAIGGFLLFNWPTSLNSKRKIFLGDAGSTFLGLIVAYFLIKLSQGDFAVIEPTLVPWLVAIPVFDMTSVVFWRLAKGKSPFAPDRAHIHQVFSDRGVPVLGVLLTILGIQVALIGLAIVLSTMRSIPESIQFWGLFPCLFLYLTFMNWVRLRPR